MDGIVQDVEYGAEVLIRAILPQAKTQDFLARITDVSRGQVSAAVTGQEYRAFPIKE